MALSIALADMRTAAKYAMRDEQADHERSYFVRLLTPHMREGLKLAVLKFRDRDDVREFVAALPEEAQQARKQLEQDTATDTVLFADVKRIRDDSFHYARNEESQERPRRAMERTADAETSYSGTGTELRADAMHPYGESEDETLEQALEMHERIVAMLDPLTTYLHHAEAAWLGSKADAIRRG
jgi:hypothetical protein